MINGALISLFYLASSVLFIVGLKGLSHPRTAVRGNLLGATGMLLAVIATFLYRDPLGNGTNPVCELRKNHPQKQKVGTGPLQVLQAT